MNSTFREKRNKTLLARFREKFGEANYRFAVYAAFPVLVSPGLLYRLYWQFKNQINRQLPINAITNVLLSGFCSEVLAELYEFDADIRQLLLKELSPETRRELADFLLSYIEQNLNFNDKDTQTIAESQRWIALSEVAPNEAVERIAQHIEQNINKPDEALRLQLLAEHFNSEATQQHNFQTLKIYIEAQSAYINQESEKAEELFSQIAPKLQEGITGIILPLPDQFKYLVVPKAAKTTLSVSELIQQAQTTNATQLDLSNLGLTEIPEGITELTNLQKLNLSNNQITNLTPLLPLLQRKEKPMQLVLEFWDSIKEGGINVQNNPIQIPPMEIVKQGNKAVLQYFEELSLPFKAQQLIAQAKAEKWKRLDLGNCGLTDLESQVPELFELEQLEVLILSSKWTEWNGEEKKWQAQESQNKGIANKLNKLPQGIDNLKNLHVLICKGDYNYEWSITDLAPIAQLSTLKQLDLSYNQITDLTPLSGLGNLTQLNLGYNHIQDITALSHLGKLSLLYLSNNQITNLTPIAQLSALSHLYLRNNQIANINPLTQLRALTLLTLDVNQISDITPLAQLSKLIQLDLRANKITNILPLAQLSALTQLYLENNKINDLSPLTQLVALVELGLGGNQITDIAPIAKLNNLDKLYLSNNQITDIAPLGNLNKLDKLYLSYNQITDVEPLAELNKLAQLYLNNNQITNLTPLLSLYKKGADIVVDGNPIMVPPMEIVNRGKDYVLSYFKMLHQQLIAQAKADNWKRLDLGNCGLTDLESQVPELFELEQLEVLILSNKWYEFTSNGWRETKSSNNGIPNQLNVIPASIGRLKNLKMLVMSGWKTKNRRGQIKHIEHIVALDKLEVLNLAFNKIGKIDGLQSLTQLKVLQLGKNQIRTIKGIENLMELVVLDLNDNFIEKIQNIESQSKLQVLYVDNNKINQIENIPILKVLKELSLANNQIEVLKGIGQLPNLEILNLTNNKIKDLKPLQELPKLKIVALQYNQISDIAPLRQLRNLTEIGLQHNQIEKLADLSSCSEITCLDLSSNKISNLNPFLRLLESSQLDIAIAENTKPNHIIYLINNPLTNPPPYVIEEGKQSVIEHLKASIMELLNKQLQRFIKFAEDASTIAKAALFESHTLLKKFQKINADLKNQTFSIGVLAMGNSGKSTFLNALMGKAFLPMSNEPETASYVHIEHNPHCINGKLFKKEDRSTMVAEGIENINRYIKDVNKSIRSQRQLMGATTNTVKEFILQAPIIGLGEKITEGVHFHLIDMPGFDQQIEVGGTNLGKINLQIKDELAMIIYLLDYTKLDTLSEAPVIREITNNIRERRSAKNSLTPTRSELSIIINKIDIAESQTATNVSRHDTIERIKKKFVEFGEIPVIAVSAYYAHIARQILNKSEPPPQAIKNDFANIVWGKFHKNKTESDYEEAAKILDEQSYISEVEQDIIAQCYYDRGEIFINYIAYQLKRLLEQLNFELSLEKRFLSGNQQEIEKIQKAIAEAKEKPNALQKDINDHIESQKNIVLSLSTRFSSSVISSVENKVNEKNRTIQRDRINKDQMEPYVRQLNREIIELLKNASDGVVKEIKNHLASELKKLKENLELRVINHANDLNEKISLNIDKQPPTQFDFRTFDTASLIRDINNRIDRFISITTQREVYQVDDSSWCNPNSSWVTRMRDYYQPQIDDNYIRHIVKIIRENTQNLISIANKLIEVENDKIARDIFNPYNEMVANYIKTQEITLKKKNVGGDIYIKERLAELEAYQNRIDNLLKKIKETQQT